MLKNLLVSRIAQVQGPECFLQAILVPARCWHIDVCIPPIADVDFNLTVNQLAEAQLFLWNVPSFCLLFYDFILHLANEFGDSFLAQVTVLDDTHLHHECTYEEYDHQREIDVLADDFQN